VQYLCWFLRLATTFPCLSQLNYSYGKYTRIPGITRSGKTLNVSEKRRVSACTILHKCPKQKAANRKIRSLHSQLRRRFWKTATLSDLVRMFLQRSREPLSSAWRNISSVQIRSPQPQILLFQSLAQSLQTSECVWPQGRFEKITCRLSFSASCSGIT
jgi:hypothetical protein